MFSNNINLIGGSDGPTAIYVSSRIAPQWIVLGVIALVAIGLFLFLRKRKK